MTSQKHFTEEIHKVYFSKELRGANEEYHLALREHMLSKVGGSSALEIGVGAGDWSQSLANLYKTLDLVESAPSLLDNADLLSRNKKAVVHCHCSNVEDFMPQPDQKWQDIFMTFLLEHLEDPVSTLKKIKQWLEPQGRLILAVPNANSIHRVLAVRMGLIKKIDQLSDNDIKVGHYRVYTKQLLKKHLKLAGFNLIQMENIGMKHLNITQLDSMPEDVVKILARSGDLCPPYSAYIGVIAMR